MQKKVGLAQKGPQLAGGGWLEMGVSTVFMSAWVE